RSTTCAGRKASPGTGGRANGRAEQGNRLSGASAAHGAIPIRAAGCCWRVDGTTLKASPGLLRTRYSLEEQGKSSATIGPVPLARSSPHRRISALANRPLPDGGRPSRIPDMSKQAVRRAVAEDAEAMCVIYNAAIAERTSTFETEPRSAADFEARIGDTRFPFLVSDGGEGIIGWAGLASYSLAPATSASASAASTWRPGRACTGRHGADRGARRCGRAERLSQDDRQGLYRQPRVCPPRRALRLSDGRRTSPPREA
ncbi:MAG: hypothetical protein QOF13_1921, partial [Solirubrobacterales bacterium]|nr:hypothetical protein [Solirubrobacterales bacterium]